MDPHHCFDPVPFLGPWFPSSSAEGRFPPTWAPTSTSGARAGQLDVVSNRACTAVHTETRALAFSLMVQPRPSSTTFVSWNKCLRNVWDSCSQRHSLSRILQELIYKSTAISCLDTTRDCAGAQNPEKQPWTEGSKCPFGHCCKTEAEVFLFALET